MYHHPQHLESTNTTIMVFVLTIAMSIVVTFLFCLFTPFKGGPGNGKR